MRLIADILNDAEKPQAVPRYIAKWGHGFRRYRHVNPSETDGGKRRFNRYWRVMRDEDIATLADIQARIAQLQRKVQRAEANAWRNGRVLTRDEFDAINQRGG